MLKMYLPLKAITDEFESFTLKCFCGLEEVRN